MFAYGRFGAPSGNDWIEGCTLEGTDLPSGAAGNNYGYYANPAWLSSYSEFIQVIGNGLVPAHGYYFYNNTLRDGVGDNIITYANCGAGTDSTTLSYCNGVSPGLSTPENVWIVGNTVSHCAQPGIHINGGQNVHVYNNTVTDCNMTQEQDVTQAQVMRGLYFYHNTINTSTYGEAYNFGTYSSWAGCLGRTFSAGATWPVSNGSGCWMVQNTLSGCATAGGAAGYCSTLLIRDQYAISGDAYGNILQNGAVYDFNVSPGNNQLNVPFCYGGVTCDLTGWLNNPPTPN
jgi:parallel beta-helix repeat protein